MTFPLRSPAGVLLSLVLLTSSAGTTQSACSADIKKFPGMAFVSSDHENKLYFISKIPPKRDVDAFQKTCEGFSKKPYGKALLGEIKTKSQYDFVAGFVATSLPVGKSNVTWAMLGIRSPTEKTISALKYLSDGETLASVFRDDKTLAKYWATTGNNAPPRNPPRYPDWHRTDTCLFMDWSNATDAGRFADGCCHEETQFRCFDTRYICQLECSPPPSGSGQRSVHGGGGGGLATSTIVGCLLGLLHYLHYTCSI